MTLDDSGDLSKEEFRAEIIGACFYLPFLIPQTQTIIVNNNDAYYHSGKEKV